jgi:cystathionine beta-lyase
MHRYGGMLSFELNEDINAEVFQRSLQLIKPSMSLAGVESTMTSPYLTSHSLLTQEERQRIGIKDSLIRFSVGIEEFKDLKKDIKRAIKKVQISEPVH